MTVASHQYATRYPLFVVVVLLAQLGFLHGAAAQGWLEDRDRAEGPGFRLGDLEVHPGIGVEGGFDSNVHLSSDDASVDPVQNSGILRVTPHIFLSTLSGDRAGGEPGLIDFRTGLSASLYEYFSTDQPTNVEVVADLQLGINRGRPFGVVLFGEYERRIRPFTEDGAIDNNYSRDELEAGALLEMQTKGGVLKGRLGYTFHLDIFEGTSFDFANSLQHELEAGLSFSFLPSTALLYDAHLYLHNYNGTSASPTELSDNVRVRSRVGINGAITDSFSFLAMVGYTAGFYDLGDEFDTIVAQLQADFKLASNFSMGLGYDRDAYRSFVGGFYYRDRITASMRAMVSGAFLLSLQLSAGHYDFGQTFTDGLGGTVGNSFDRTDWRFDATLFAEYRLTNYLGINARLGYGGRFTDYEYVTGTLALDPAAYNRFSAWAGVRVFY